jgi:hypothetical protein
MRYSNSSQFVQESDIYHSCTVKSPARKSLKIHWHGWYVHITFPESSKWKAHGRQFGWSGWPRNVAATKHIPGNVWFRYIPVIMGMGSILLLNHIVYIQLLNQEVLQHIEVHVTRNGSLCKRKRYVKLCSAYSTEKSTSDCPAHFRQPNVGSVVPRWLGQFIFPDKWKVALSLVAEKLLSKNELFSSRRFNISVQVPPTFSIVWP